MAVVKQHIPTLFAAKVLLLAQLDENIDQKYRDTRAIVAAIAKGEDTAAHAFSKGRELDQGGLEFVTSTPLARTAPELAAFLTAHLSGEGSAKAKGYALSYVRVVGYALSLHRPNVSLVCWLVPTTRSSLSPSLSLSLSLGR